MKFILTGGTGTGKSTVLEILEKEGYCVMEECARRVIAEEGNKPDGVTRDTPEFPIFLTRKILEAESKLPDKICFLDRSVIDNVAYLRVQGIEVPEEIMEAARNSKYDGVFFFEMPPEEKYGGDQTYYPYERSMAYHTQLKIAYEELGYKLIHVPFMPYNKQTEFIEKKVETDFLRKLAKKSKLTVKDAKELSEKINRSMAKKFNPKQYP